MRLDGRPPDHAFADVRRQLPLERRPLLVEAVHHDKRARPGRHLLSDGVRHDTEMAERLVLATPRISRLGPSSLVVLALPVTAQVGDWLNAGVPQAPEQAAVAADGGEDHLAVRFERLEQRGEHERPSGVHGRRRGLSEAKLLPHLVRARGVEDERTRVRAVQIALEKSGDAPEILASAARRLVTQCARQPVHTSRQLVDQRGDVRLERGNGADFARVEINDDRHSARL